MKKNLLIFLLFTLLVAACSGPSSPPLTETPLPATATNTLAATPLPNPSSTPKPSCAVGQESIRAMKELIPYEEFALTQYVLDGERALIVWFVNPEINPASGEADLNTNFSLAVTSALQTVLSLRSVDGCVTEYFDTINPIVVDSNYNSWFAGVIDPVNIPADPSIAELDSGAIFDFFTQIAAIQEPPEAFDAPPAESCDWLAAQQSLLSHVVSDGPNVGAYLIIDQAGVTVWAQWDGPSDRLGVSTILNTLSYDLSCLHPQPDQLIFIIVDEEANAKLIGIVPGNDEGLDVQSMEILRQED